MNNQTTATKRTDMTVAVEIMKQLGGRRFIAMTGSTNFVYDNNSLTMKLRRNQAGAQYLNIKLNGLDLYDMKFTAVNRNFDLITKAEKHNVYFDCLTETFTEVTGLYTSL
jgi:hypothetical protein